MAAKFMGYSPVISVDSNTDHIWVASSPDFLTKCSSGKDTLAESAAYKATMAGLPKEGVSMTYLSKDFATFLTQTIGKLKEGGMLENAGEEANAQIDNALKQFAKVKNGTAQVISTDAEGILLSERNVQNIEQQMAETLKLLKTE